MKNDRVKKEFRLFLLTDYEAEELYLSKRHKEGYAFCHVTKPGVYTFEKCEPADVIYRLDFNPLDRAEKEDYLQMYQDYGWEYLDEMNDYSYFRKSANELTEGDSLEIFNDSVSKMDMLKRIFFKRMSVVLAVMALIVVPQMYRTIIGDNVGDWGMIWSIFWCVIFVLYVAICVHCGIGFYKLHKKYSTQQ